MKVVDTITTPLQIHIESIKAVTKFEGKLQRHEGISDKLISSKLIEVRQTAFAILRIDVTHTSRD